MLQVPQLSHMRQTNRLGLTRAGVLEPQTPMKPVKRYRGDEDVDRPLAVAGSSAEDDPAGGRGVQHVDRGMADRGEPWDHTWQDLPQDKAE